MYSTCSVTFIKPELKEMHSRSLKNEILYLLDKEIASIMLVAPLFYRSGNDAMVLVEF